jgi:ankyrin repeat protein
MVLELDRLICYGTVEEVRSYIERNPLSVQQQCPYSGTLPLHRVVSLPPQDWYEDDEEWQQEFFRQQHGNHQNLHRKEKVQLLIESYPEGLTIKDHEGRVPLHAAVRYVFMDEDETVDVECMELLAHVFNAFPAASRFRDSEGLTPLELAITNSNLCASLAETVHSSSYWTFWPETILVNAGQVSK